VRQLSAYEIVRLCEWGRDRHPVDRALMLLRAAAPEADAESLARLPVGRRDALLLQLRARTSGERLEFEARCRKCGERLEFANRADELLVAAPEPRGVFESENWKIEYRLPDSNDLAAIAGVRDAGEARARLIGRCVVAARRAGAAVAVEELPEGVRGALAARLAEEDPQADITFKLRCPACGHAWTAAFDILSFFWSELEAHARQLDCEVAAIARAFGWAEEKILAMSAARRARYLELAAGG
jgi:hypothetical protein